MNRLSAPTPRAVLTALLALLVALVSSCAAPVQQPRRVHTDVSPVPIDRNVDRGGLGERLTRWIDGSQAWDRSKRAGYWSATQTDEDKIVAELEARGYFIRAEIEIKSDEVQVRIADSEGLGQQGNQIHERAMVHIGSLRKTIRTALRSDDDGESGAMADGGAPSFVKPVEDHPPSRDALSPQLLGEYHALVIGNDDYTRLPRLRTAVADARAVATLLEREYDFRVTRLENASRHQIVSAMNAYRSRLDEDDNLLIYYAGHGWFDEDAQRGYWLPTDAREGDPTNWVSNATITDMLRAIPARHVLVVADSCYSGTLTRGIRAKSQDRHLTRLAERRSRTALTSGGLEPVEDGQGRHSVFATAFMTSLAENDGILDGQSLFTAMRRPVMLDADQTPEYSDIRKAGHDGGDFLFARRR